MVVSWHPSCEQTPEALTSAQRRVKQAATKLANLAATHSKQTFHLLRATAGACKIEYLLQTLTRSRITDDLVADCSADMRAVYPAIFPRNIDDSTWAQAKLPQRDGGFGLRDPKTIIDTAGLASLVNVSERALGFGAATNHIETETEIDMATYVAKLGTHLRPSSLFAICRRL